MALSNPMQTSNAGGFFTLVSDGFIQGEYQPDPSSRYFLAGGVVAASETIPMWGGVPITESIPPYVQSIGGAGKSIARATAVTTITGFTVATQMSNAIIGQDYGSAPSVRPGMGVQFARLNSDVRLAVAMDPGLAGSLVNGAVNTQVSWDFNNSRLQAYDASTSTTSVASLTPTFNAGTGIWTIVVATGVPSLVAAVGDAINLSGVTNTGTGGAALVNGNFIVTSFTSNENFSFQVAAPAGAIGTLAGTIVLNNGTGALNVEVLQVQPSNCMTISYNSVTGMVSWNYNGAAAIIKL